jgi:hypothetical protein
MNDNGQVYFSGVCCSRTLFSTTMQYRIAGGQHDRRKVNFLALVSERNTPTEHGIYFPSDGPTQKCSSSSTACMFPHGGMSAEDRQPISGIELQLRWAGQPGKYPSLGILTTRTGKQLGRRFDVRPTSRVPTTDTARMKSEMHVFFSDYVPTSPRGCWGCGILKAADLPLQ